MADSFELAHAWQRALACIVYDMTGGSQLPPVVKTDTFDSNIITPGTGFMDRLATALQYYVHVRLNGDKGWRGIEVG
jgi:5'-3' exonuclease